MDVETICARCSGKGSIDRPCADPQCGDSTWDHDCTLGSEPCENCRCPNCGKPGLRPVLQVDPLPIAVVLLGRVEHVELCVTVVHRLCPSCDGDFIGHDASSNQDAVASAFRAAVRQLEARVVESMSGEAP